MNRPAHINEVTTPRIVKLLGADPRFPENDGDLTAEDLAELDAAFAPAPAAPRGGHRIAEAQPFSEEWLAESDRQCQQRKDSGADRAEQYERALAEQMQRAEILR